MGRAAIAEPIHADLSPRDERARQWRLARDADDRRSGDAHGVERARETARILIGPEFSIAAFKGVRLTLRDWNLQLRQPILLSDGRMVASISPQEGYLHQTSELDTLGRDRPETKCRLR